MRGIYLCCGSVPVPFTASFVAGSDLEFSVHPQIGELPAASESNPGTLITVTFQPTMYGKNYNAKLLIQVKELFGYKLSNYKCRNIMISFSAKLFLLSLFSKSLPQLTA